VAYPSTLDLLIFVGVPLAVVGIIFALVYASHGGRGAKRYRPGRPYPFAPVWFLARPEKDGPAAVESGIARAALTAPGTPPGRAVATDVSVAPTDTAVVAREHPGVTGGASDRW
jgi:hypothetical protein